MSAASDLQERDNSRIPAQIITATGMGICINIACATGRPVTIPQFTTLNEVYGILVDESLGQQDGKSFNLRYYGVGVRGSQCAGTTSQGITRMVVNQHMPIDGNAFTPIPLVARQMDNDLTDEERKKYRTRTIKNIDGVDHILYWTKLMGFEEFNPVLKLAEKDEVTGNESVEDYIPKQEDLNPEPIDLSNIGSVPVSNQYINATGKVDLSFVSDEMEELKNACRILYGDAGIAALSEFYIAFGRETMTEGKIGKGGTGFVRYNELLSTVIAYHITETHARDTNANNALNLFFDLGSSVPMIIAGARTTTIATKGF